MERWLETGRRIKAEWAAMLEGLRARGREKVKLPFVPLRVSPPALRAVLEDMLPLVLGKNPSLLTVISEGGSPLKAYCEDASGGVYERLERLDVRPGASSEELLRAARTLGVEVGVTKTADIRFFELFPEEPEDLLRALSVLVAGSAKAIREGWLRFEPALPVAALAGRLALDAETWVRIARSLVPEGRYGLALLCTGGAAVPAVAVSERGWSALEVELAPGTVASFARQLVEVHSCGIALAIRLPDVARLARGETGLADLLRSHGEAWAIATRSGLEGVLPVLGRLAELAGLGADLEECNVGLDSFLALLRSYVANARRYAREKGVQLGLAAAPKEISLTWDAQGLSARAGPDPIRFDPALVRRTAALLASDPLSSLRELVPREVMDRADYSTAAVLLDCARPAGRLLVFGGPHRFFDLSWKGDACAVFMEGRSEPAVAEHPGEPLLIEGGGSRVGFEAEDMRLDLRFDEVRSRRDVHGPLRGLPDSRLAEWLPGLEVRRGLHRLASGKAEVRGRSISLRGGWMYLEEGSVLLLRWPFGFTWHYVSFLEPDGECGSAVRAVPMLGESVPTWWERLAQKTVDGLVRVAPGSPDREEFRPAFEPGVPPRIVRDSAWISGRELAYEVLSAVVAPFDEEGNVLFRLRCLCGNGIGLVELPASLPGHQTTAAKCDVEFGDRGLLLRALGRELLFVDTGARAFLKRHEPRIGLWGRIARAFG